MKYILVTGGIISGIGKGIVTSSIGALLKACNVKVTAIKIDPYINIDAGTFSPFEHGEVFVLNDGCEADLDLGNYERFLDINLERFNNITTGKIYQKVINKERRGDYLGKTVQVVPHLTDAIQEWIETAAKASQDGQEAEVCLIELGGTIGDIESAPFIEALRQLRTRVKRVNFLSCHVSLVPCAGPDEESKSKPTQASAIKLRKLGLSADMIVCRGKRPLTDDLRDKISNFAEVELRNIFSLVDLDTIYRVPLELERQGILQPIASFLGLKNIDPCAGLHKWTELCAIVSSKQQVIVALLGKYTARADSYMSVTKALEHACYSIGAKLQLRYLDSALLEAGNEQAWTGLKTSHCLVVPGGFGIRGTEGKIAAIKWARENRMPFLGICLGFQLAVVEFARSVLHIKNANSAEFEPEMDGKDYEPLVIMMLEYQDPEKKMGGTMRLGSRKTVFNKTNSILYPYYGKTDHIQERHRHRYEINPKHITSLEEAGLLFVGKNEDATRMEIMELDPSIHPYFVGVQFHPEYQSRPFKPSPPYKGLIEAAAHFN